MSNYFAPLKKDGYKIFHRFAYKPGVTHVYSNFTNRFGKHSNVPDNASVVFVGLQYFIIDTLIEDWGRFFAMPKEEAVGEYSRVVNAYLGKTIEVDHIEALHDLGYLPLEIKALEEGTFVPYAVPSLTVVNTEEGFGWLTNMIETVMSAEIWSICTSATTAAAYRSGFSRAVKAGLPEELLPFMGHDFSYRGMQGTQAAAMSGFGHLCSFAGSDTIPAGLFAEKYYGVRIDEDFVMASVDATEHSVMCSYEDELESLRHLMNNVTPSGILSVVSDSWDFYRLVTEYLPLCYDDIMARDGTLVIRPDSGDPVNILTGYTLLAVKDVPWFYSEVDLDMVEGIEVIYDESTGKYFGLKVHLNSDGTLQGVGLTKEMVECEVKGLIECLWDTFGGTTTEQGYKLLDSHIGAIYGDSITLDRQEQIITRLLEKGFVPSVVLGIGSYTYQYVTRDTHGSAMKATDVQEGTGNHRPIMKDPKTDSSKKSAKGLLMVVEEDGVLKCVADVTPEQEASEDNLLKTVFKDGALVRKTTLLEIRDRINHELKY